MKFGPGGTSLTFHLALNLARTRVHDRPLRSVAGKMAHVLAVETRREKAVVTRDGDKSKTRESLADRRGPKQRVMGFEPTTFTLAT